MSNFGLCDTCVSYFSDFLAHKMRTIMWNWNTFVMRQLNSEQDRDRKGRGWKLLHALLSHCCGWISVSVSPDSGSSPRHAPSSASLCVVNKGWPLRQQKSTRWLHVFESEHVFVWCAGRFFWWLMEILPPIIVHLVPWYHSAPPHLLPTLLICIQMTFLSSRLHHSPVMNEPPSFT